MFFNTRIRLTIWYIAIVAIVSFSFSAIIYRGVITDLERGFMMAEAHLTNPGPFTPPRFVTLSILSEDFEKAKHAVAIRLISINGVIIAASGIAAYILAGKTLEPLQLALEEQKRFTADAGHELKTPLTALRTELEVALRDKKTTLRDVKALLKSNLEEVISLQRLSENLMLLNRYSQTHNGLHTSELNGREIIEKATKKLEPLAKAKKIKIAANLADAKIKADAQSLEELIVILLDNAIKYSPEKSVVEVRSEVYRNNFTIEVKDHGTGISKEDQEHLFDRFYRADVSRTKNKADGFGLGLAIAKEIVERHKGEISVSSKLGQGSTFTIVLPA